MGVRINYIKQLLSQWGWTQGDSSSDYESFHKEDHYSVDIGSDEIVLIGERGDFLHLPIDRFALYGALVWLHQIEPTHSVLLDDYHGS